MSFTPEKIPTTKEELTHKVLETYENLLDRHEKGLITNAQLDTAVRSLLAATGWAIDKNVFMVLSDANIEEDDSFAVKRSFLSTVSGRVITIKIFCDSLRIEVWSDNKLGRVIDKFEGDVDECRNTFLSMCAKLLDAEIYKEIK